jgi:DNA processing protein
MAVPGSPLDPRACAANGLIRQGSLLVRNARGVIEALASLPPMAVSAPMADLFGSAPADPDLPADGLARLRMALTPNAMALDELSRASGLTPAQCRALLMELELGGEAVSQPGGLVARAV